MKEKKRRRAGNKSFPKWLRILLIVIALLLVISITTIIIIYNSFVGNINKVEIDKNDLEVNNDLYNNVSDKIEKKEFDQIVNVAFFGSDSLNVNDMYSGRSDSIMIASINPVKKSIKLISIPRDTYVNVPNGYGWTKINHAYAYGQEQLSLKTINSNFGLDITQYVTINFSGLVHIINDVGGIQMEITEAEKNYINTYVSDSYELTRNPIKYVSSSGKVVLNGEQALIHSRNRTVGSDFVRASRQRDVLVALMNKISSMDESKILSVIQDFLKEVKTNIDVTSYLGLLTSVVSEKNSYLKNIISVQIPTEEYGEGKMIDGVYYFVSDLNKCKEEFVKYLYDM